MTMQVVMGGPSDRRLLVNFATGQSIAVMTKDEAVTVEDAVGTELTDTSEQGSPAMITEEEI